MRLFPSIETERLLLNQAKPSDIPDIVRFAGNKKLVEHTRTMPHPYFEEDAISWLHMANEGFKNGTQYIMAIRLKSNESFMGGIGLTLDLVNNRAELGYWVAEPFWNKGFATEAVGAIIKYGFEELNLNKIIAVYLPTNEASGKVMIKNGMVKEAELKDHDIKRGTNAKNKTYVSLIQYRLTKTEFESNKSPNNDNQF